MEAIKTDLLVDAKGLACPMPIVRTKKAINELEPGQVLVVHATDKGSKADIQAWAKSSGHQYLGTIDEDGLLKHYLRKANDETIQEQKHPLVVNIEELIAKISGNEDVLVLDVREAAEFAFQHIPGALSIPLGELEERAGELNGAKTIYVVCRTGNRSDFAAQILTSKGFENVFNVVPGMCEWSGPTEASV